MNNFQRPIAKNYFIKSLKINNSNPITLNNLGIVLAQLGQETKSINYFDKAIKFNNEYIDPIYNLLEIYEKTNKLKKFKELVLKTSKKFPRNQIVLFYKSVLLEKQNLLLESLQILEKLNFKSEHLEWEIKKQNKLGNLYHSLKKYDQAFSCFKVANNMTLSKINYNLFKNNLFMKQVNQLIKHSKKKLPIKKRNLEKNYNFDLCFLIGFPRSGTTLLDTILRTHPSIKVLEERPLVENMLKTVNIDNAEYISQSKIDEASLKYLSELKKYENFDALKNKIVIDKLPLNIVYAGIIHQLLPNAKFIIAIRHPLDCILSCFSQNFELNHSMINFLNLKRSSIVYDKVMQIWKNYYAIPKSIIFEIKYENLINDFEKKTKELLFFLNLKWNKKILTFYKTANNRDRIRTPSYQQVVKPIYNTSKFKWKNYKKHLEEVKPKIEKWIRYFNYDN